MLIFDEAIALDSTMRVDRTSHHRVVVNFVGTSSGGDNLVLNHERRPIDRENRNMILTISIVAHVVAVEVEAMLRSKHRSVELGCRYRAHVHLLDTLV